MLPPSLLCPLISSSPRCPMLIPPSGHGREKDSTKLSDSCSLLGGVGGWMTGWETVSRAGEYPVSLFLPNKRIWEGVPREVSGVWRWAGPGREPRLCQLGRAERPQTGVGRSLLCTGVRGNLWSALPSSSSWSFIGIESKDSKKQVTGTKRETRGGVLSEGSIYTWSCVHLLNWDKVTSQAAKDPREEGYASWMKRRACPCRLGSLCKGCFFFQGGGWNVVSQVYFVRTHVVWVRTPQVVLHLWAKCCESITWR